MGKITTAYMGDMLFESKLGNHNVVIDMPSLLGGKDRGPTPSELFIAALGSSIGGAVADYCQRLNFDTHKMTVDITFNQLEKPTRLANLRATIRLPHCICTGHEQAILQLTEQCLLYESFSMLQGIQVELVDKQNVEVLKWLA
jgi:putative redox protein